MRMLALTSLALLVATPAFAQQWTAEQQEVIDANEGCWEAWATEDMSAMRAACDEQPEAAFWVTNTAAPRAWRDERQEDYLVGVYWPRTDVIYYEVEPLKVSVIGDVGLIYNWAMYVEEDTNGERRTNRERRLDVYKRIGDGWSWIGAMVSPES